MPPKALVTTLSIVVTTLRLGGDTIMSEADSQLVTRGQLQEIVNYLQDNNQLLKEKINSIGIVKVKLPLIERFLGERLKLKGFLIQMYFKVI